MPNSYKTNPWFIDAAGDASTAIPTYHNGAHVTYHITKVIVFGATVVAGDTVEIQDKDSNVKVKFIVRHKYCDWINVNVAIQGLNMVTMTHGDAYIYTE